MSTRLLSVSSATHRSPSGSSSSTAISVRSPRAESQPAGRFCAGHALAPGRGAPSHSDAKMISKRPSPRPFAPARPRPASGRRRSPSVPGGEPASRPGRMPARTTRLIRSQPRSQRQRPPLPVGVRPAPMRSAIHQRASPGRLRECHLSTTAAWPKEECQPRTVVSNPRPWPPARSGCDALLPEDRKPIPESDMPPGTPPWMRSSSGRPAWAAPLMLSAPQSRSGSRPASGPGRSRPGSGTGR